MSKNRKVIFLRKENGDGQGEFYYPDGSKYVGKMGNIMEKASSLFIMVTILRVNGGMVNLLDM